MAQPSGTPQTKAYYQDGGWAERAGTTVEANTFGGTEDGPLRLAAHHARLARIRAALELAVPPLSLLEAGGGGQPFTHVLDLCSHYTNIDFAGAGLDVAQRVLDDFDLETELIEADMCDIPIPDHTFDAVYSAHAIYHIADERGQRQAFSELLRVLRPGGVAVFILANPRPLLFPVRMAKRIIADTPGVSAMANRVRKTPPIPYKPLTISTMTGILRPHGTVSVTTAGMGDYAFNQRVTEYSGRGKQLWRLFSWLETSHPSRCARFGNNIQITVTKATA